MVLLVLLVVLTRHRSTISTSISVMFLGRCFDDDSCLEEAPEALEETRRSSRRYLSAILMEALGLEPEESYEGLKIKVWRSTSDLSFLGVVSAATQLDKPLRDPETEKTEFSAKRSTHTQSQICERICLKLALKRWSRAV